MTNLLRKQAEIAPEAVAPSAADLRAISRYARRALTAQEVYCRKALACNTAVDRVFEHFSEAQVRSIARSLVGAPLLGAHDYESLPLGRIYKSETALAMIRGKQELAGYTWFYVMRTDDSADLIARMEGGVLDAVSIGYAGADGAPPSSVRTVCDICGKEWCEHSPGEDYDGKQCTRRYVGELRGLELSLVFSPAQYDAALVKAQRERQQADPADADDKAFERIRARLLDIEHRATKGANVIMARMVFMDLHKAGAWRPTLGEEIVAIITPRATGGLLKPTLEAGPMVRWLAAVRTLRHAVEAVEDERAEAGYTMALAARSAMMKAAGFVPTHGERPRAVRRFIESLIRDLDGILADLRPAYVGGIVDQTRRKMERDRSERKRYTDRIITSALHDAMEREERLR